LTALAQQLGHVQEAGPREDANGRLEAVIETARAAVADVRRAAGAYREAAGPYPSSPAAPAAPIVSPLQARWALAGVYLCDALVTVFTALAWFHRLWTLLLMVPVVVAAGAVLVLMRPSRRQTLLLGLLLVPIAFPLGDIFWELNFFTLLWPFFLGPVFTQYRRRDAWIVVAVAAVPYTSLFFYPPPLPNPPVSPSQ
jgi:hypothetical protein